MTSPSIDSSSPFASWSSSTQLFVFPNFDTAVAWYEGKLDFRLIKSSPLGEKMYGFMVSPAAEARLVIELIAGPGTESR